MILINNTDITDIAESVTYKESWNNGAGQFTFQYPTSKADAFPNGSVVIYVHELDGKTNFFYGWLFKTQTSREKRSCLCYDQLRYLKATNFIARKVQTLDSFVNDVCALQGDRLRIGKLDKTEAKLAKYTFQDKTMLDMLYQSIQDNLLLNGYRYTLRDNFGAIELIDTFDLRLPLVIGDSSLATEFEHAKSIDDDTFNYVKVAKDDTKKGVRDVIVAQDSASISRWGKLVIYDKVSANLNDAQLKDRANRLLKLKNRETETLSIESIGDIRVRAGNGVKIEIKDAGISLWAVVNEVTHEFHKTYHTMKLNLIYGV